MLAGIALPPRGHWAPERLVLGTCQARGLLTVHHGPASGWREVPQRVRVAALSLRTRASPQPPAYSHLNRGAPPRGGSPPPPPPARRTWRHFSQKHYKRSFLFLSLHVSTLPFPFQFLFLFLFFSLAFILWS